jgi:cytochrome d ubiquinol oxidase subunit I
LTTLIGFAALYTVLLVIETKLMLKAIRKGPEHEHEKSTGTAVPILGHGGGLRTAPMISEE